MAVILTSSSIRCSPESTVTSSGSQTSANAWLEVSTASEDSVDIVRLAGEMNPSGKRGYPTDLIIQSLGPKMKA